MSSKYQIYLLLVLIFILQAGYSKDLEAKIIILSSIQQPKLLRILLKCSKITPITFQLSQNILTIQHPYTLMLRLDYEPNKCIFASQDIIKQKESNYWTVEFNKTCCNLNNQNQEELVKVVATVRYAHVVLGFPVSVAFLESILPVIFLMIVGVLTWMIFVTIRQNRKQEGNYQTKRNSKKQN